MATRLKSFRIQSHGRTDLGLVRENNEDAWHVDAENQFFILCDGMGGHTAGEVASQEAVSVCADLLKKKLAKAQKAALAEPGLLEEIILDVNAAVYGLSRKDQELRGMGTTLCCGYVHRKTMVFGHVGDSRIYLFRDSKLSQLTEDHSLVMELLELGELRASQARDYAHKNIITRAIGTEPVVVPSVQVCELRDGDQIIICSDGLSDLLSSQEISKILSCGVGTSETVDLLISAANRNGGLDNVTVILTRVTEDHG